MDSNSANHNFYFPKQLNIRQLFDSRFNPFLKSWAIKKEKAIFLNARDQLQRDYAQMKEDGAFDVFSPARKSLQRGLLYMYAAELVTGKNVFPYKPPFSGMLPYITENRVMYFNAYKEIFDYYQEHFVQNKIFVDKDYTIKDAITNNFGNTKGGYKVIIDDELRKRLIDVEKIPLTKDMFRVDTQENFVWYKRYLTAQLDGEQYLFTEIIRIPRGLEADPTLEPNDISYHLNVVAGQVDYNRILYRMDYKPKEKHLNKLVDDKEPNFYPGEKGKEDEYIEAVRKSHIENCHVHIPTINYSVVFPNKVKSCDSFEFDIIFDSLKEFISANRHYSGVKDSYLIKENARGNENLRTLFEAHNAQLAQNYEAPTL
jgi:hypothetical protein